MAIACDDLDRTATKIVIRPHLCCKSLGVIRSAINHDLNIGKATPSSYIIGVHGPKRSRSRRTEGAETKPQKPAYSMFHTETDSPH